MSTGSGAVVVHSHLASVAAVLGTPLDVSKDDGKAFAHPEVVVTTRSSISSG